MDLVDSVLNKLIGKGTLTKMRIIALSEAGLSSDPLGATLSGLAVPPIGSADSADTFTVLVNPQSFRASYENLYNVQQPMGASSTEPRPVSSPGGTLTFELIFDGTGVIAIQPSDNPLEGVPIAGAIAGAVMSAANGFSSSSYPTVMKQIKKFHDIVYKYDGTLHRPKKVRVEWGALIYVGVLTTLNYDFKVFDSLGQPLRATASVTFKSTESDPLRLAFDKVNSPDLTHRRVVNEGDTLPLMCHRIYRDSSMYIQIAKINNLLNFRKLEAGQELFFPPIEKGLGIK